MSELGQLPAWVLLMAVGGVCVILGASQQLMIAGNSIQFIRPYNLIVVALGGFFILFGVLQFRRQKVGPPQPTSFSKSGADLPVKEVTVSLLEKVNEPGKYPRVRLVGKVDPPVQGIRVWILREHFSDVPGSFHVGARPALTDKNGEWQQFTSLWEHGSFRIHAVIANSNAELLFTYYRDAFEHARRVYTQTVDGNANTFPDWPLLYSIPGGCISDHKTVVI